MAAVTTLLCLALTLTVARAELVITGCANSYIRLTCSSDDTLHVRELRVSTMADDSPDGPCANVGGGQDPPVVPEYLSHICPYASECIYEEDICKGKNDCVFYVGANFLSKFGTVQQNSVVNIVYDCSAGMGRIGGLIGICVVTLGLVIAMVATTCILCRKLEDSIEDESKYVEFENRVSRSGSMSSEISAKIKDRNANKDKAAEKAAEAGLEEVAIGGLGVKSSTSF